MNRAYYSNHISAFLQDDPARILGRLADEHQFDLERLQKIAWRDEITLLKQSLTAVARGYILLEYAIPRMGKRIDVVILLDGVIFAIEFKIGERHYSAAAIDQVLDYALDLKNFHAGSHDRPIVPILVATEAPAGHNSTSWYADQVHQPIKCNARGLATFLCDVAGELQAPPLDPIEWRDAIYKPTPTIIEAAQALYRGHSVAEITRADADAINLSLTTAAIGEVIEHAKRTHRKAICFVTGVPGAGKTLAGLNIANERLKTDESEHAVFLSGNGPLVHVLREALARNEVEQARARDERIRKQDSLAKVRAFIQNIHHFRDEALISPEPPVEKVAIFDEAQRAWTQKKTAEFMKGKRQVANFSMSEPEFLMSIMDRHPDWAVIVCLVGGGQEINSGEAGIIEWLRAINCSYKHWPVYISPNLSADDYIADNTLNDLIASHQLTVDQRLHLAVSVRTFRAGRVSDLVKAILDNDADNARAIYKSIRHKYPIAVTRDLDRAKRWLKAHARGSERYGLLASSGAIRLRPIGVHVKDEIEVEKWFLNDKFDVRSSYALEQVATEFDIQGLELDWTCLVWDADLRYIGGDWQLWSFTGTSWHKVRDVSRTRYLKNAYRVLLTRARQGMVIVVPHGNPDDITRPPKYYDGTFEYLVSLDFDKL